MNHYEFSYKDFLMLKKIGKQQKTKLAKYDFKNTVVFKPWGFEYLIYEDKDCCGWFLHIDKHFGTSLHCHMTKQTMVCVVSGLLLLTMINRKLLMMPGDMAIFDKKVFHAMGAATDDTRVIELEMPSYKPDAVRAVDFWGRKGKPYENKCLLLRLQKSSVQRSKGQRKRGKT